MSDEIQFEEFSAHASRLSRMLESADFTPELSGVIRNTVLDGVWENFAKSSNPEGGSWPPRKVVGDGHPLLIDTMRLMEAATGGGGSLTIVEPQQLVVGVSGVPYAGVHNYGSSRMPQREYMGAPEKSLEAIDDQIADAGLKRLEATK